MSEVLIAPVPPIYTPPAPPAAPIARSPLSPGQYIQLRRRAAGFTTYDVGVAIGRNIVDQADVQDQLANLEAGRPELETASLDGAPLTFFDLVDRLTQVFALDALVYHALVGVAASPATPAPQVCRSCGCTWHDPCGDDVHGACAWTVADPELCTACERTAALPIASNDAEPARALASTIAATGIAAALVAFIAVPGRALATLTWSTLGG